MVNIIILSKDQAEIIKRVIKSQIIQKILQLLLSLNPTILNIGKKDGAGRRNLRHFIGFIIQAFRFFVVCQSIDHKCFSKDGDSGTNEEIHMMLTQVLRKYE